jgi:hypothetical protein
MVRNLAEDRFEVVESSARSRFKNDDGLSWISIFQSYGPDAHRLPIHGNHSRGRRRSLRLTVSSKDCEEDRRGECRQDSGKYQNDLQAIINYLQRPNS